MFTSGMKEATNFSVSSFENVPFDAMLETFRYLYTENPNISGENAVNLLILANDFALGRLMELVEVFLQNGVDAENVCEMWEIAEEQQAFQLWKYCKYVVKRDRVYIPDEKVAKMRKSLRDEVGG